MTKFRTSTLCVTTLICLRIPSLYTTLPILGLVSENISISKLSLIRSRLNIRPSIIIFHSNRIITEFVLTSRIANNPSSTRRKTSPYRRYATIPEISKGSNELDGLLSLPCNAPTGGYYDGDGKRISPYSDFSFFTI